MSNPLEDLLSRLMESGNVNVLPLNNCDAEANISRLQAKMADTPDLEASVSEIRKFAIDHIRRGAKEMKKSSRKRELEMEMRMLDKPDNIDLGAEENKHFAQHIEEEQLQSAVMKREAEALLKFCDLFDAELQN